MFDTSLNLTDQIDTIEVTGVPVVIKNIPDPPVFDVSGETFVVKASDLKPVNGTGLQVPAGTNGSTGSGARSFESPVLKAQEVSFTVLGSGDQRPRFEDGKVTVRVLGKNSERLDITQIVLNPKFNGYNPPTTGSGGTSPFSSGDFLKDSATGATQVAAICLTYGVANNGQELDYGDPRFRARLVNERWRNINRSDKARVDGLVDRAELNIRAYAFDWYDHVSDRPVAFIRNEPLLNIGELGNVCAAQYPWRTVYLQHPERPSNTAQDGPEQDIPALRRAAQDYALLDIFRAGGDTTRSGSVNINSQGEFLPAGASTNTHALKALFFGIPVGAPLLETRTDRLSTNINILVNTPTVAPSGSAWVGTGPKNYRVHSLPYKRVALPNEVPTEDNNPPRPYFQPSEVSRSLSRLFAASEASDTASSGSISRVNYSVLRNNPQTFTEANANYKRDIQVEQAYREVSNAITTRGNVFRVLYVGQSIKDQKDAGGKLGEVENASEIGSEYLGEAFVERIATYKPGSNPNGKITSDSTYRIIANRIITE